MILTIEHITVLGSCKSSILSYHAPTPRLFFEEALWKSFYLFFLICRRFLNNDCSALPHKFIYATPPLIVFEDCKKLSHFPASPSHHHPSPFSVKQSSSIDAEWENNDDRFNWWVQHRLIRTSPLYSNPNQSIRLSNESGWFLSQRNDDGMRI